MQSYYEINVAKNGRHFFATAERSARDSGEARQLIDEITKRFPETDGYTVSATYWEARGTTVK